MRKKFVIPLILLVTLFCTACKDVKFPETIYDVFCADVIDDKTVAVGDLSVSGRKENKTAYFIPEYIKNHQVVKMGYQYAAGGNGFFNQNDEYNRVETLYAPYSIKSIYHGYLFWAGEDFKLMYCGSVVDLAIIDKERDTVIFYVPSKQYELYEEKFSGKKECLKKANVVYDLNYTEHEYYYVDYVESNNKIENIPPAPIREGYEFVGWYKDIELSLEFSFENDTIVVEEDSEVRLYAKWKEL